MSFKRLQSLDNDIQQKNMFFFLQDFIKLEFFYGWGETISFTPCGSVDKLFVMKNRLCQHYCQLQEKTKYNYKITSRGKMR